MKIIIIVCLLFFTFFSFEQRTNVKAERVAVPVKVKILPLGKVPFFVLGDISDSLRKYFPHVEILNEEDVPQSAYNKAWRRYSADSLIDWLNKRALQNEKWVAVTNVDISTSLGRNPNKPVVGLANDTSGTSVIVSCYRVDDIKDMYKVVLHEVGHTLGLKHCPDNLCYMERGGKNGCIKREKYLCKKCIESFIN